MDLRLPESLERIHSVEGGPEWVAALPRLVSDALDRWSLRITGDPFPGSYVSLVVPVTSDDEPAVLKIQFPHDESAHEAEALRVWDGDGAIRLLGHEPDLFALLVERCRPGDHLADAGPEVAMEVLIGLLPRLWVAADGPFRLLDEEARGWIEDIPGSWERTGRRVERRLIDAAVDALAGVIGVTSGVLLHQDLHGHNVLQATREPWLVIDPKPLVGDRAFSVAPIVRSYELGHSEAEVLRRFDRLVDAFDLDSSRAAAWTIGQTIAWAFEGDSALERHVETARWLVEHRL
ncbi:MAG TPA: aminoglycoside phosphotransferase family protein [Acidimicrobiia bacterium]|nr:aminoglycoside phosphotransferase family protein [Acidimicrobiia bacterium]